MAETKNTDKSDDNDDHDNNKLHNGRFHSNDDSKQSENVKFDSKNNDLIELCNASLYLPESSSRKVRIVNVSQRRQQNVMTSSKYHVYELKCKPNICSGVVSVHRRYNDFKWLRHTFCVSFPCLLIPPIAPAKVIGRYEKKFVIARQMRLQRFLDRIVLIKPLANCMAFYVFLSRPSETLSVGKEEISRNHIPKSISQMNKILNFQLFPQFRMNKYILNYISCNIYDLFNDDYDNDAVINLYKTSANALIFGSEIAKLSAFLSQICSKLSKLCDLCKKLNASLVAVTASAKQFNDSFWKLHALKSFGESGKDFYGFYNYNRSLTELNSSVLHSGLYSQYSDICAFMEVIAFRNKKLSEFEGIRSRMNNWQKLIDADISLQPHQITQIIIDKKMEKQYMALLLISTKAILNYHSHQRWKELCDDWTKTVFEYAQQQLVAHQITYAQQKQRNVESYDCNHVEQILDYSDLESDTNLDDSDCDHSDSDDDDDDDDDDGFMLYHDANEDYKYENVFSDQEDMNEHRQRHIDDANRNNVNK